MRPLNFVVLKKFFQTYDKNDKKQKYFPPENVFSHPKPKNLATGLVLLKLCLQLGYFVLKAIRSRDVAQRQNVFYKSPLGGPCKDFGEDSEFGFNGTGNRYHFSKRG